MLKKENTGISIKSLEDIKKLYIDECLQGAKEHIIHNFKKETNRELTKDELNLISISLLSGVETFTGFVGIMSNHMDKDIYKKDNSDSIDRTL